MLLRSSTNTEVIFRDEVKELHIELTAGFQNLDRTRRFIIQAILDGQTAISMEFVRQSDIVVAHSSKQHIATKGAIENKGNEIADKSGQEHSTTRDTIQRTGDEIKLNSERQHEITREAFRKGNDLVIETLR